MLGESPYSSSNSVINKMRINSDKCESLWKAVKSLVFRLVFCLVFLNMYST